MISKYSALIFDMDGTLIDSMGLWRKQNLAFLERHNLPVPEEIAGHEMDCTSWQCAELFIKRFGLPMSVEQIIEEYEACMAEEYKRPMPEKPGAMAFLRRAHQEGYRMCVATLSPSANAMAQMRCQGIEDLFSFVMCTKDIGMHKRDPKTFERLADMLGVAPQDCLVFEDALYAMKGAKAAGCGVCAIDEPTARLDKDEIMRVCDRYLTHYDQVLDEL